jgi:hypothetical protein
LATAFGNVFAQLVAMVEPHHTVTVEISPAAMGTWHASGKTASAAVFNSIAVASPPAASPTIVHIDTAPKASTPSVAHAASVVVASSLAKAPREQLASYVTQSDLTTQLQAATNALRSLIYQEASNAGTVGEGQYSSGDITNNIALSNKIDQLSGVAITGGTITNATVNGISGLSAAEIPALPYLSTSGGSLTGALGIGTTSPSDLFALNGAAYLADIAVPPVTTNRLYSNSGNLYWAGNLLGGATTGNWSSDGTNVWRIGGNVGIGTTSPGQALTVQGSGLFSGALNANAFGATNATSTNLFAQNASFTAATTTNLFASLANITSGIFNSLTASVANITGLTATNATTTNLVATSATTTNLAVTGTTALTALDLSGNILSTLNTSVPPSSLGNWSSIGTAFTGDLSHMGFGISRQTTGTALGTPVTGYLETPELSAIASYYSNRAGWNQSTSGNSGRTGAQNLYLKDDNYGEGDMTNIFCNGFVDSTRSGATSFLASPEVGCLGGGLYIDATSSFAEGIGDLDLVDQNTVDAAAVAMNFNFTRTNAAGATNNNWWGLSLQNQGTLPIDDDIRSTGATRVGIDFSALTFPDYTLVSITLSSGGSGYTAGDLLLPPDGTYDQQTVIKVLTVDGSGTILTFALDRAGLYSATPASPSTVSGGTGTAATFILQYSTGGSPALVTKANNCWYGNATQDTGVYSTSLSSTLKLGQSWVCYSSSLGAWNFVTNNASVLQMYSNQVIVPTIFKTTGNVGISTTTTPLSALVVSGGTAIGADYNKAAPTNGLIVEGNVGIGTTSPATTFSNAGNSYIVGGLGVGVLDTNTGTLQTSGNATIGGVGAFNGVTGTTTIASVRGSQSVVRSLLCNREAAMSGLELQIQ